MTLRVPVVTNRLLALVCAVALCAATIVPALAAGHRCVDGCQHCAPTPAAADCGCCCEAASPADEGPGVSAACGCECRPAGDPAPPAVCAPAPDAPDHVAAPVAESAVPGSGSARTAACRPAARAPPPALASTTVLRR